MTEIRKEIASILRKLRNLGYEHYEIVRPKKEVLCSDLDGNALSIKIHAGESIHAKDVLDLLERYKQMYPDSKNELYFEVDEYEDDYGGISSFIYLKTKKKISDEEYYKFLKEIYSEHLQEQYFQKLLLEAEKILGRSVAPYQIKILTDLLTKK